MPQEMIFLPFMISFRLIIMSLVQGAAATICTGFAYSIMHSRSPNIFIGKISPILKSTLLVTFFSTQFESLGQ